MFKNSSAKHYQNNKEWIQKKNSKKNSKKFRKKIQKNRIQKKLLKDIKFTSEI